MGALVRFRVTPPNWENGFGGGRGQSMATSGGGVLVPVLGYSAPGGVVLLEGRVSRTPNDPVLQGAKGGAAGRRAC